METRLAIELNLVAATIRRKFDRMQVNGPAVRVLKRDGGGQPVSNYLKSLSEQGRLEPRYGCCVNHEIEVGVVPGLLLEEGVDAPAAVDPGNGGLGQQLVEDSQYLVVSH